MNQANDGHDFFKQLEQRLLVLSPPVQLGFKRDRWLIGVVCLGLLMTFLPWKLVMARDMAIWLTLTGTVLQLIGAVLIASRQIRDVMPDFMDSKQKFAAELDEQFVQREEILAWLRSIPTSIRQPRMVYVEARLESLRSRYPIVFGAVDRLGVLPVLVGVLIQYQALKSVSGPIMLLGLAIVGLYLMSLWMVRYRIQLEGYIRVLRAAD